MLARCAHCQKTFSTDRFGVQRCPHCGWEVLLADPSAPPPHVPPPGAGPAPTPGPEAPGPEATPPPPVPPASGPEWGAPPPPPGTPPPAAWGTPTPWGAMAPGTALPSAQGGEGDSAPFARRRKLGFLTAFGQTWRLAAFEPRRFFRFAKVTETGSALLFGVISFCIGTWISLVYAALAGGAGSSALQQLLRRLPPGALDAETTIAMMQRATFRGIVGQALITPIAGFVGIYVAAAVMHLLLLAVRGAPRGFSATLTVVAYAYGMFLLEALPMCGGLVAIVWFVVTAIVGISESQRCGMGKAGFAVLTPALFLCACLCASLGLLAAQFGGSIPNMPEGTGL